MGLLIGHSLSLNPETLLVGCYNYVNPEWYDVTDRSLDYVNAKWFGVTVGSVPFNWQEIISRSAVSGVETNSSPVKYSLY